MTFSISVRFAGALAGALFFGFYVSPSQALTFQFSFTNVANGGGSVQGIISGLADNATSGATSVQVTANSSGFGIGEYVGTPNGNQFTVASGILAGASFADFAINNLSGQTCCSFSLMGIASQFSGGLNNNINLVAGAPLTDFSAALVTPLPATLPLFGSGLGILRILGWRRKKKAPTLTARSQNRTQRSRTGHYL